MTDNYYFDFEVEQIVNCRYMNEVRSFFKSEVGVRILKNLPLILAIFATVFFSLNSWGQALPDPPTYYHTGNPSADSVNYSVAKEEWISDVVDMFETHLGQMEPQRKTTFIQSLRSIDFEAARNGDYTLPIIENPYPPYGVVELHH